MLRKCPSPVPRPILSRPILEKWDATYLILHPDGTTYWAHRSTIKNRQMLREFDEGYKGIGLDVDVYEMRQKQNTEYLLHFRGRPEEESYWAREDTCTDRLHIPK
jgi:hypothetical protein